MNRNKSFTLHKINVRSDMTKKAKKRQRHARVFFLFLFFNMFSNIDTRSMLKNYVH